MTSHHMVNCLKAREEKRVDGEDEDVGNGEENENGCCDLDDLGDTDCDCGNASEMVFR